MGLTNSDLLEKCYRFVSTNELKKLKELRGEKEPGHKSGLIKSGRKGA
jgi:hypothetical protein